jgi:large subunit ribosomal protein L31
MAKKEIVAKTHPKQHKVHVTMTNGDKFDIFTVWGKEGDSLKLDVDTKNHPAWQEKGQSYINVNDERVTKFKQKFGDFKL